MAAVDITAVPSSATAAGLCTGAAICVSSTGEGRAVPSVTVGFSVLRAIRVASYAECEAEGRGEITSVIPTYLQEARPVTRPKRTVAAVYGTEVTYTRYFTCPPDLADDAEAGVLALGSPMWAALISGETLSQGIDGPRVQHVQRRESKQSARVDLVATFVAVPLPNGQALVTGYNETKRWYPEGPTLRGQFGVTVMTAGIAPTRSSYNIPREGRYLDNYHTTVYKPICTGVRIDETSHQGRVIVYATWRERMADVDLPGPDDEFR